MDDYDFRYLDFDPDWAPSQEDPTGARSLTSQDWTERTWLPDTFFVQANCSSESRNYDQVAEGFNPFLAAESRILELNSHPTGRLPSSITAVSCQLDGYDPAVPNSFHWEDPTPGQSVSHHNLLPVSGCDPREDSISVPRLPSALSKEDTHDKFLCKVPGCKSKGFLRKRDLTKHNKKHTQEDVYDCPAMGCSRTGDRANCLRDKFIDHLRRRHLRSDTTWSCPWDSCNEYFQTIEQLAEHLRGGHGGRRSSQEEKVVSAIFKASNI
ncbi:hypothetical protein BDV97DRAFT_369873 [Delphinella strobiligena]|nr:hypothetical protein BDV97DRAFT_369873 [Delphinella strobiligena]